MNKNVTVALLSALVVALCALVLLQNRQAALLKAVHEKECAVLKQQAALAEAKRAVAKQPPTAQPPPRGAPAPQTAARVVPAEPASPAAAPALAGGTNFMGAIADLMKNPQMKEMVKAQQKVMVDQMYAALPRYLNLPPEQQERLSKLLLERQLALAESGMAMMKGSAEERKKALEESKSVSADYDRAIQELLGDSDYEVFKQYEKSMPEQTHVTMFKNSLTGENSLSEQQEYDLVSAMYQARKDMPADSLLNRQNQSADPSQFTEERMAETLKQMEVLQQRYAEGAASILNAAQLERFRQWQQQMAAMQQAGLKIAAQMFGQGKPGAAAPAQ